MDCDEKLLSDIKSDNEKVIMKYKLEIDTYKSMMARLESLHDLLSRDEAKFRDEILLLNKEMEIIYASKKKLVNIIDKENYSCVSDFKDPDMRGGRKSKKNNKHRIYGNKM